MARRPAAMPMSAPPMPIRRDGRCVSIGASAERAMHGQEAAGPVRTPIHKALTHPDTWFGFSSNMGGAALVFRLIGEKGEKELENAATLRFGRSYAYTAIRQRNSPSLGRRRPVQSLNRSSPRLPECRPKSREPSSSRIRVRRGNDRISLAPDRTNGAVANRR